jgi:hypothetical protein
MAAATSFRNNGRIGSSTKPIARSPRAMKAASVVSRRSPICSTCKRSWTLSSTANRHRGQSQSSTIACGHSGSPIISFAECRSDTLGRAAARIIAQQAAKTVDGLSSPWVEAAVAVAVALNGRKPRVTGVAPAVELAQLTRALSRVGLVLILEPAEPDHAPAALVRALEWIAQNAPVAVVAIFPQLPANDPPWDRLLYFARQIVLEPGDFQPDPRAAPNRLARPVARPAASAQRHRAAARKNARRRRRASAAFQLQPGH